MSEFLCFKSCFKKSKVKLSIPENARHGSSLGGNFVTEHGIESPISDTYDLTTILLGTGSSAKVVVGKHKATQRRYAIKIIDTTKKNITWRYEREKQLLKEVDHTNIVRLLAVYTSPRAQYFVMELCSGGHLGYALKEAPLGRLDSVTAKCYITQIIHAVAHCHKNGICHRDIKLQNILLESNAKDAQVKLVDFGNSTKFKKNVPMTKIVGTTYTAAPEVFKECYDERCDVWSIGVVAYILLSGQRPFIGIDVPNQPKAKETSVIASILMGRYHFLDDVWEDIDDMAIHFVQVCLEMDYRLRHSSMELLDHLWLSNEDDIGGMALSRVDSRTLTRRLSRNLVTSGLRRTSMLAVAFAMPTQKQQYLRSIFQRMDKNGSGTVEREEFRIAMQSISPNLSLPDIDLLFDTVDQDGNNRIGFIEFIAATIDPREVDVKELNNAFHLLDKDSKGFIDTNDLKRVLSTSNNDDSDKALMSPRTNSIEYQDRMSKIELQAQKIVQQADLDKDGVISYTEFLFAMADGTLDIQLTENLNISNKSNAPHNRLSIHENLEPSDMLLEELRKKKHQVKKFKKARRQSDTVLNLSGKSFRKRTSIILQNFMTYNGNAGTKAPPTGRHSFTAGMTKMLSFVTRSQQEKNNTGVEGERLQRVDNVDDSPLEETEEIDADNEFIKVNRRNTAPTLFWNAIRRSSIFGSNNELGQPTRRASIFKSFGKLSLPEEGEEEGTTVSNVKPLNDAKRANPMNKPSRSPRSNSPVTLPVQTLESVENVQLKEATQLALSILQKEEARNSTDFADGGGIFNLNDTFKPSDEHPRLSLIEEENSSSHSGSGQKISKSQLQQLSKFFSTSGDNTSSGERIPHEASDLSYPSIEDRSSHSDSTSDQLSDLVALIKAQNNADLFASPSNSGGGKGSFTAVESAGLTGLHRILESNKTADDTGLDDDSFSKKSKHSFLPTSLNHTRIIPINTNKGSIAGNVLRRLSFS